MPPRQDSTETAPAAPAERPAIGWAIPARMAGLALAYALLALWVLVLSTANGNVTLFWMPGGLALAALLAWGRQIWPGVLGGALAAGILIGDPLPTSLLIALGNTLETLLCHWLLQSRLRFNPELTQTGDFLKLAGAAAVGACASALLGPAALLMADYLAPRQLAVAILHWWQADLLGILLGTPLLLVWRQWPSGWLARERLPVGLGLFPAAFLVGQAVFLGWFADWVGSVAMAYWMFLFVVWAAARYGRHGALLIIAMTAAQALHGAAQGVGFFSDDLARTGLQNFWFYMLVLTVVGIALAIGIEERLGAMRKLGQSEARYRTVVEQASDALLLHDLSGRLVDVNRLACESLGYAREELLDMSLADLDGGFDLAAAQAAWRSLRPGQACRQLGYGHHRRKDGSTFPVEIRLSCCEIGGQRYYLALARDIGERLRAEAQLRESELRLRQALKIGGMGSFVYDIAADRWVGSALLDSILGIDAGHPRTLDGWKRLIHPDDRPALQRALRATVAEGMPFDHEYRIVRPGDGTELWLKGLGEVLFNAQGQPCRVVGTNQDVTERKRAEETLRESQRELELILDNAPALIWYKDTHNRILRVNAVAAHSIGLPKERIEGRHTAEFYPEEAERYYHDDLAVARSGRPRLGIEEPYRLPSGEIRWIHTDKVPMVDESGQVARILVMAVDITERKQAEEALRKADRQKDEFLATLAHELRTPLAPIGNGLKIIRLARNSPQADYALDMLERQLAHLIRLIDDLLDLGRISRGKIELRKARAELATIARHAVETSRPLLAQAGHEFRLELPDSPIPVEADPVRLTQAFANLLNNAAKYTPPGGRVTLAVEPPRDRIATVRVRDSGIGIPAAMLEKVFDPFEQTGQAPDCPQGGLGIGLCLVKKLVELHGGRVEARSEGPGQGSEFVVRLPTLDPAERMAEPVPLPEPAAVPQIQRRVLIADDNDDSQASLAWLLGIMGHRVQAAKDGLEAVEAARWFRPELILLDIGMPRLDGYQACRRLRAEPWGADVVIAALTGWGQDRDRQKAWEAGFDHYFVKPVDHAALRKLLDALPEVASAPPDGGTPEGA
jgi:PAS domain S-box-containing protein